MKKKKNSSVKILATVVLVFSTTLAVVFGFLAASELLDRKQSAAFYESVGNEKVMAAPTEQPRETQPTVQTTAPEELQPVTVQPTDEAVSTHPPVQTEEQPSAQSEAQPTPATAPAASEPISETSFTPVQTFEQPASTPMLENQETAPKEVQAAEIPSEEIPTETEPLWDIWCGTNRHIETGTRPSVLDFEAMRVKFPDCVGWMELPALKLDTPVVQGEDNDYYLNHLPNRRESANGSLMMDVSCRGDFHSDITTIHGHFLQDGAMFGNLREFQNEEFYKENPTFMLYTPDGDYTVEIFAVNILDGMEFGYPTELDTQEDFNDFITAAREASPYQIDVDVRFGDRIILLSTCSYKFQFARFIVFGVLR